MMEYILHLWEEHKGGEGMLQEGFTVVVHSEVEYLIHKFHGIYTQEDFDKQLHRLKSSWKKSSRPRELLKLYEMLETNEIVFEKGEPIFYYEELIDSSSIYNRETIKEKFLLSLQQLLSHYPSPEEYMLRIVNRLENEQDRWECDTLRVRILKRFVKYGDSLKGANFGGEKEIIRYIKDKRNSTKKPSMMEIIESLDDDIFNVLEHPLTTKKQKQPSGKYGLLKLVDDLASGKFRTSGATKRALYLFAMVYDMLLEGTEEYREIEKNLFQDYYTNNLLRYLSEDFQKRKNEYEITPSGQGINYKNFAEVVYLYWLTRPITAAEKIRMASEMIERLRGSSPKVEFVSDDPERTRWYKEHFKDSLRLEPAEFEQYVATKFDCQMLANQTALQVEIEQQSAFEQYKIIIRLLEELGELQHLDYGVWVDWVEKESDSENYTKAFKVLLRSIHSLMTNRSSKELPVDALSIQDANKVTRTDLLIAYYYYYTQNPSKEGMSLSEIYIDFIRDINPRLEKAYYQPINEKSVVDLIIIFSAYVYINFDLF